LSGRNQNPETKIQTFMSLRIFLTGLVASFALPWLALLVVPFAKMRAVTPVHYDQTADKKATLYHPKREGRTLNGALVYAANGCNQCHSQLVRPTYAGNDLFRPDWGGVTDDGDRGDTRRETNVWDYQNEKFAQIGVMRVGPDLSNLGRRVDRYAAKEGVSPEQWLYRHLYDPRAHPDRRDSRCPAYRFLFVEKPVYGTRANDALPVPAKHGGEILPGSDARALVSYLLGMRKDDALPAALNPAPKPPGDQPG
jgi:cytochrome c oxidase cbb3-type subunit II